MALYIPHSIFHLARLLYVRPETFGPYCVPEYYSYEILKCVCVCVAQLTRSPWSLDLRSSRPTKGPVPFHLCLGLGTVRVSFCIAK